MWPAGGCSSRDLARQTPRQTFELWRQLNNWRKAFSGELSGEASEDAILPDDPDVVDEQEEDDVGKKGEIQKVGGLGLANEAVFEQWPGEVSHGAFGGDPFSLPRRISRERSRILFHKLVEKNMFHHLGLRPNNPEATDEYFVEGWKKNSRVYECVRAAAFVLEPQEGLKLIKDLAEGGELDAYQVQKGDMKAAEEFHKHIRECAQNHPYGPVEE